MPELPEVETVKRALSPHIEGKSIVHLKCFHTTLRYPLTDDLQQAVGQKIVSLKRRSKYLIMELEKGYLLLHLGMSGRLYWQPTSTPLQKHDHVEWTLNDQCIVRFQDPRRFGLVLWTDKPPYAHRLLAHLGPEPLSDEWQLETFYAALQKVNTPIKTALMHGKFVVGVGNIYANEALFASHIHPLTPALKVTKLQLEHLMHAVKRILQSAIASGGTTLKDFTSSDGSKGYFQTQLNVYKQTICSTCSHTLTTIKLGGRHTTFCENCQLIN